MFDGGGRPLNLTSSSEVDAVLDRCNGRLLSGRGYRYHTRTRGQMGANGTHYILGCFAGTAAVARVGKVPSARVLRKSELDAELRKLVCTSDDGCVAQCKAHHPLHEGCAHAHCVNSTQGVRVCATGRRQWGYRATMPGPHAPC